jgi:hypothetical protein
LPSATGNRPHRNLIIVFRTLLAQIVIEKLGHAYCRSPAWLTHLQDIGWIAVGSSDYHQPSAGERRLLPNVPGGICALLKAQRATLFISESKFPECPPDHTVACFTRASRFATQRPLRNRAPNLRKTKAALRTCPCRAQTRRRFLGLALREESSGDLKD